MWAYVNSTKKKNATLNKINGCCAYAKLLTRLVYNIVSVGGHPRGKAVIQHPDPGTEPDLGKSKCFYSPS